MSYDEPPLVRFAIIASFIIAWYIFVWFLSRVGGWHKLEPYYRSHQSAVGRKWKRLWITIGSSGYNNTIKITTNADGLFMDMSLMFRVGHPRLFIPWQEFHDATLVKDTWLWPRHVLVQVGHPTIVTMRLYPEIFEQTEGRKLLESPIETNVPTP